MSSRALTASEIPRDSAVIVGRQPIVDRDATVVAFELLYRSPRLDRAAVSGEQMTADVLLGAMTIGVDQLVGAKTMYCNADRDFLVGGASLTLPADRTVIEVLETVEVDDEVVEACRRLVEAGFRIALDDFTWREGVERLLELASVVKLDLLSGTRAEVLALAERCRPYGVSLLAEKVETADDVAWARQHGFDLFQGYAIERPALVHGRGVGTSGLGQAQLALTMLTEELDLDEIEEILRREPGLVVQMLQLASVGARDGLRRQVHTVREALVLLGSVRIRQWVALTILDQQPSRSPDGLVTALTRARMAEELARTRGCDDPEFAFTAGLLSALDLLMGVPLSDLADSLGLSVDIKRAAFERVGETGLLIEEVVSYQEHLHGPQALAGATDLDLAASAAFAWAMPYVQGLAG